MFGGLEAHHINGNSEDNRFENLISLCNDCHLYKAHNGSWKNKPTKTYQPKALTEHLSTEFLKCFPNTVNRYATETIEPEEEEIV